jgi:hypothetical protein
MEVWIKDLSDRSCYTRFGKEIPKKETKIDVIKYFGRDVVNELKNDKLIKVIVHNAKNLGAEKKEAEIKEEKAPEVKRKEAQRKKTVSKNLNRKK